MKAFVLGIDVNRASADPTLFFKPGTYEYNSSKHLDETAQKIADFVHRVRSDAKIVWAMQHKDTRPGFEADYSYEERAFHRVLPNEHLDSFLKKTRMSPYEENRSFFENMKEEGYDTVVLAGFYATECIYWTMQDLINEGFRVVLPTDLVAHLEQTHPLSGFDDFITDVYHNRAIFTDSQAAEHFLKTGIEQDRLPPARFTWDDMNSMYYGAGS